ncbi:hypothetical protein JOD17_000329 [Geomicrobium sediminis]|uniref:Uncharacterized protein n=1 Tax=Geomicrobium sediminis TaxID=1347788 RepID=A0ABS2P761_9BACL|nr:hypothetical protein [Geomicrobium sediminis]
MEIFGLPAVTAFWLFVPMSLTILLSAISYIRFRRRESQ